jgi:hypothetical protein
MPDTAYTVMPPYRFLLKHPDGTLLSPSTNIVLSAVIGLRDLQDTNDIINAIQDLLDKENSAVERLIPLAST